MLDDAAALAAQGGHQEPPAAHEKDKGHEDTPLIDEAVRRAANEPRVLPTVGADDEE